MCTHTHTFILHFIQKGTYFIHYSLYSLANAKKSPQNILVIIIYCSFVSQEMAAWAVPAQGLSYDHSQVLAGSVVTWRSEEGLLPRCLTHMVGKPIPETDAPISFFVCGPLHRSPWASLWHGGQLPTEWELRDQGEKLQCLSLGKPWKSHVTFVTSYWLHAPALIHKVLLLLGGDHFYIVIWRDHQDKSCQTTKQKKANQHTECGPSLQKCMFYFIASGFWVVIRKAFSFQS